MTSGQARVEPLTHDEYRAQLGLAWDASARKLRNITRTWAHNPALLKAQRPLQDHFRDDIRIPHRARELAILRVAWLYQSEYVFAEHAVSGAAAGLTPAEIAQVASDDLGITWPEPDLTVLQAVDELVRQRGITDTSWSRLRTIYDVGQILDLVSVVGRYWTVAAMARSIGVELEAGRRGGFRPEGGDG
jgi:alkylhydroperoxidase family enzyme